ncbi:MAG: hypothetical protein LAO51_15300 [Acidobacteriia bacterium]|nr:hypothetical protein [Terriglobia bacterium]
MGVHGNDFSFPAGASIAPGQFPVLAADATAVTLPYLVDLGTGTSRPMVDDRLSVDGLGGDEVYGARPVPTRSTRDCIAVIGNTASRSHPARAGASSRISDRP